MDSRLEDNKTTTPHFTKKEIKEKELVGLLEIYALYRDRRMLPYQGRDPYVTDDSKTISHRIAALQKEIKNIPPPKEKDFRVHLTDDSYELWRDD